MPTSKGLRRFGVVGAAILVGLMILGIPGCAAPGANLRAQDKDAVLAQISAGKASLDCGILCSANFIFRQQSFLQLYRQERWEDLALAISAVRWRQDLTYFYLGAAAEGLKYYEAADRYYRIAGYLASNQNPDQGDKCASVQNLCGGFSFPRDVSNRLRGLAQERQTAVASSLADARLAPTISNSDSSLSSDSARGTRFIADAPQTLLLEYVADRLRGQFYSGNPARESLFANQSLEALNPLAARESQGNEIARPQQIQELKSKLASLAPVHRMALGMFVQLTDYDMRSMSFTVRYPLFYGILPLNMGGSVYRGQSQRPAGVRGYSASGTTCVWEPNQGYPRPDLGSGFFVMMTACVQHPPPGLSGTSLPYQNDELPPAIALVAPKGSLWNSLQMRPNLAQSLITRMGPTRMVWAELVFDTVGIRQNYPGPYTPQTLQSQRVTPLAVDIVPAGLIVWDTSVPPPADVLAGLGATRNLGDAVNGRLTASMIGEVPPPATANQVVAPAPATLPVSAPVPAKAPIEDDWIVPPPAKK